MIPGRISGCADITNHFALFYSLSHRDTDCRTVRIECFEGIAVADFDVISIPAAPGISTVRYLNRAVRGGENRRPCRGCDVRPVVIGGLSREWILPVSKVGGYGEALRQRPLENPCPFPVGIRRDNFPGPGGVWAEQLRPKRIGIGRGQQRDIPFGDR